MVRSTSLVLSLRTRAAGILLALVAVGTTPSHLLSAQSTSAGVQGGTGTRPIPRTRDGKPDLQGIWQVRSRAAYDLEDHAALYRMPGGRSVVEGDVIPYQPWAAAKKRENVERHATADPLAQCYLPGVPRIMYMEFPFQIFQTRDHVAMTFEWQQVFRLIHTNGSRPATQLEFWMGDSRGRWEGDTLTVDVKDANGKVVNWAVETAAANQLYRRGWRPEDAPSGTLVTVEGWLARNGTPMANANRIMLPDGRRLFAGAAEAASPPSP